MSLLSACQNASREAGFFSAPATVIANTTPEGELLETLANRVGKRLSRRFDWQSLVIITTITTASSTAEYSTLSDFDRFIFNTWWDTTNNRKVSTASPQLWEHLKNGLAVSNDSDKRVRQYSDSIFIHPTPTATETLTYEYISDKWVSNAAGDTFYTTFQADTDVPLVPEELFELELLWRIKKHFKSPYLDDKDEAERAFREYQADDGISEIIVDGTSRLKWPNVKDGDFPAS